ncbi:hypothetical protein GCM10014715_17420 [Streptomyces spiralis]|uniref:Uncharacterized protein n=2 Tax=Streptomyces spiralis TaxID=66376 RepID=A0A918ZPQ5_9ACTN|nr:hypothetical protein GCM10014715_17420 [Streptomyces spiralis]
MPAGRKVSGRWYAAVAKASARHPCVLPAVVPVTPDRGRAAGSLSVAGRKVCGMETTTAGGTEPDGTETAPAAEGTPAPPPAPDQTPTATADAPMPGADGFGAVGAGAGRRTGQPTPR